MATLHPFFSYRLLWLAIIAIFIMTMSQVLGHYVWQLELFSHYVPQVAVLVLLAAMTYPKPQDLGARLANLSGLRIALTLVGVFLAGWSLQPWAVLWQGITTEARPVSKSPPLVIAYQNVNIGNPYPDEALDKLLKAKDNVALKPDIVALVEAGGANWQKPLDKLARHYPTHCGVNESSPFAMQVYAMDVAATCEILTLQGFAVAKLTLFEVTSSKPTLPKLTIANQPTHQSRRIIYIAHPPPPISGDMAQARNAYLSELATRIKADSQYSVMVVGDFNLSAFSPRYRDFIRSSATSDKRLQRTTLTGLPTWLPFGIGIDQVIVNSDSNKVDTQALSWAGSDHRGFRIVWD